MSQSNPIIQLPFHHIYGFDVTNGDPSAGPFLKIRSGQCRDQNNVMDILLGERQLDGPATQAPLTIDNRKLGPNGLDQGTIQPNKMYNIYVIADSSYKKPVAGLISLNGYDDPDFGIKKEPLLPAGYDSYRLIAYWPTNIGGNFIYGYINGNSGLRQFIYDVPQKILDNGSATSSTPVSCLNLCPLVNNIVANFRFTYNPTTPNETALISTSASGNPFTIINGQVSNTAIYTYNFIKLIASITDIVFVYFVTNSADTLSIDIQSFWFNV